MDSTDLSNQVFHAIFIEPAKLSKEISAMITDWNQALEPSFNMVKGQFRRFIETKEGNTESLCVNVNQTLQLMTNFKCAKNFMRAYLATIKSILSGQQSAAKKMLLTKIKEYEQSWQEVNPEILESYFEAFSLKQKVTQQQQISHLQRINQFIEKMINRKKYNNCLDFIKFLGVNENKDNIEKLMAKMSNKKDASKAADYVKKLKLDPKSFPAIGQRLYKSSARHFLSKQGWQYAEQIFEDYPEALACIVEDLIYKKKFAQARSIWSRHPLWQYLQKQESKQYLKEEYNDEIIQNYVLSNDIFGPPNKQKYLDLLLDFNITEQCVEWVDANSQNLNQILRDIQSADILGIDTQSIVGQTKFQKAGGAAIIQVSTGKKIYIFDGFQSTNQKIGKIMKYCFQHTKIIGHSFTNDTQGIFKAFGLQQNGEVQIKNLIDICKVYKGLNQKSKFSSLAHICKQVFNKQLCKDQTLTNWKRRPLRKNQLHYAALDAHVVIQIYNIWLKEYGQIVHYHAAMENDQI